MVCMWHPKNKRIYKILPNVLVSPDMLVQHLSVLLYSYCENMEKEIETTLPLRDDIDLNVSAMFGVRYTDLRGLPSRILVERVEV